MDHFIRNEETGLVKTEVDESIFIQLLEIENTVLPQEDMYDEQPTDI